MIIKQNNPVKNGNSCQIPPAPEFVRSAPFFTLRGFLFAGVPNAYVCKNGLGGWRTTTVANGPEISRLPYRQLRLCQWRVVIDAHNGGVLLVFGPAVGVGRADTPCPANWATLSCAIHRPNVELSCDVASNGSHGHIPWLSH
jgi:hypothetical protein